MLVKNIVKIEKGTLIKGLTVKPHQSYDPKNKKVDVPRIATLNIDGWEYPIPSFDCSVVRTLFYPESSIPSYVRPIRPEKVKELGINKCLISDPWNNWAGYRFLDLHRDTPIGVHMSEFIFACISKRYTSYINLYTKVLLITGEIGYLTLETDNKSKIEAELV